MTAHKTEQEGMEQAGKDAGLAEHVELEMDEDTIDDIINNIIDNYQMLEESIVAQLGLYYKQHGTETGTLREDIWLQLFEQIIPKKFCIEHSVFIIDSHGNKSKEIDLAIVDQSYTPYIFQYGRLKFIPIEAVAAVIECKSQSLEKSKMETWLEAVKALKTSRQSIARMANCMVIDGNPEKNSTQTATRPIRILCGYQTKPSATWKDFDFCLIAASKKNPQGIELLVSETCTNLEEWHESLNHCQQQDEMKKVDCSALQAETYSLDNYKIMDGDKEAPLMSFNFLFNQLLMLINNPILFPHVAYANLFNRKNCCKGECNR